MHTALRAAALLLVAGALGGGLLIFATDKPESQLAGAISESTMTLSLTSPAFESEGTIPSRYTCDGAGVNPPLSVEGVPEGAQSLVLIMEDPDVPISIRPDGMWDHWVVFNIPPEKKVILEGGELLATHGVGTAGATDYRGPCPPNGEHRYFFKLFALDTMLGLNNGATKLQVLDALRGHVLAETSLMGRYERMKK